MDMAQTLRVSDGLALIWGVSAWYENPKKTPWGKEGTYSPINADTQLLENGATSASKKRVTQ